MCKNLFYSSDRSDDFLVAEGEVEDDNGTLGFIHINQNRAKRSGKVGKSSKGTNNV